MNNQAPELSPEARRLINEARGADDPTAEDHARVKARWLASVAAVAGVSSLTEAARAAGGIGWGFKAVGAALVVAAGAIGLNFALDSSAPAGSAEAAKQPAPLPGWSAGSPERFQKTPRANAGSEQPAHAVAPKPAPGAAVPAPQPALPAEAVELAQAPAAEDGAPSPAVPQPVAPLVVSQPVVSQPVVSQPVVSQPVVSQPEAVSQGPAAARARPVARAAASRASTSKAPEKEAPSVEATPVAAPAAAGPSGQLSEELALLSDVRSSIQEGAAVRALELLNRYESRFGQPILGMEADALRVDALCKAGQRDAARESARAFQNEWPGSPLERRVSAACP